MGAAEGEAVKVPSPIGRVGGVWKVLEAEAACVAEFPSTMEALLSLLLLLAPGALWAGKWEQSKGGNVQNLGP